MTTSARSKHTNYNDRLVGGSTDDYFEGAMHSVLDHTPGLRSILVMPSWDYTWMRPPSGFVATFEEEGLFKADLFFTNMWSATAVTRVDAYDSSTPLPQEKIDAMELVVRTALDPAPTFADADTQVWSPSLGDHKSYIGLYTTETTNPKTQMAEQVHLIVCRSGMHTETYEEMESFFIKCEEDGMTNKEVFHHNPTTEAFRSLVTRNRRRIVYDFAEALGLSVRFRTYSSCQTPYKIANIDFETETNFVKFENDTMLFYSECTDCSAVTQGLVLNRAPLLGPLVYLGPNAGPADASAIFGGNKWYNKYSDAFPVGLGLHASPCTWAQFGKVGFSTSELSRVVLSDGEITKNKLLLRTYPYRDRDETWTEAEEELGYNFKDSGLAIRTTRCVIVKLNS